MEVLILGVCSEKLDDKFSIQAGKLSIMEGVGVEFAGGVKKLLYALEKEEEDCKVCWEKGMETQSEEILLLEPLYVEATANSCMASKAMFTKRGM